MGGWTNDLECTSVLLAFSSQVGIVFVLFCSSSVFLSFFRSGSSVSSGSKQ